MGGNGWKSLAGARIEFARKGGPLRAHPPIPSKPAKNGRVAAVNLNSFRTIRLKGRPAGGAADGLFVLLDDSLRASAQRVDCKRFERVNRLVPFESCPQARPSQGLGLIALCEPRRAIDNLKKKPALALALCAPTVNAMPGEKDA